MHGAGRKGQETPWEPAFCPGQRACANWHCSELSVRAGLPPPCMPGVLPTSDPGSLHGEPPPLSAAELYVAPEGLDRASRSHRAPSPRSSAPPGRRERGSEGCWEKGQGRPCCGLRAPVCDGARQAREPSSLVAVVLGAIRAGPGGWEVAASSLSGGFYFLLWRTRGGTGLRLPCLHLVHPPWSVCPGLNSATLAVTLRQP